MQHSPRAERCPEPACRVPLVSTHSRNRPDERCIEACGGSLLALKSLHHAKADRRRWIVGPSHSDVDFLEHRAIE